MLATPVPFPAEALYETQKVSVFSYVGKGLAADVGASLSTIPNDSVWLVPMFTDRGALVNAEGGYLTLTWVTLSGGTVGFSQMRAVTWVQCWMPGRVLRYHIGGRAFATW